MNDLSDITIVSVAYNSMEVLPRMLDTVPDAVPVVIVDNASKDVEALAALACGRGATLIRNAENAGFGRACNQGAERASTRYLLFLNPDAALADGALQAILDGAKRYPEASAFNPRLLDGKGGEILRRRSALLKRGDRLQGPIPDGDFEVPILSGAAIFVAREMFQKVGGFDPAIFLYHEDDDLALRLKAHGPLMRLQSAVVTHQEGRSSARTPQVARFKAYYLARSRTYARAKHGHRLAAFGTIWQGFLQFLDPTMLVARRRAKAAGFLSGAFSALRDGGRYDG